MHIYKYRRDTYITTITTINSIVVSGIHLNILSREHTFIETLKPQTIKHTVKQITDTDKQNTQRDSIIQ